MTRKNRLNNRMLRNMRREPEYQAVITDLVLLGKITKAEAKKVLGYEVPDYLSLDPAAANTPAPASLDQEEEEVEEPTDPDEE